MTPTLLISDLHLSPARPAVAAAFHAFARGPARDAAAVYILGDLFDCLGRRRPVPRAVCAARSSSRCARCPTHGVALLVARGNRDFLLGEAFARATGATLLGEQTRLTLGGTPTLLSHGDELCTDDIAYQRYRAWSRNPARQRRLLRLPYRLRRWIAAGLRRTSRSETARKPESILDVNPAAIERVFGQRRAAADPRAHASPGTPRARRRRHCARADRARGLGRAGALPRGGHCGRAQLRHRRPRPRFIRCAE